MTKLDKLKSLAKERYSICQTCEFKINGANLCRKCGCFIPAKTILPITSCPIGKWGKMDL